MDRTTVLTGWEAGRIVSYLEVVALNDRLLCEYPDWSLCYFNSLDTLLDSVRVKRGYTHGLREFKKNILKNKVEKCMRKVKVYRNEINPQYDSPVLVWDIESQKLAL